MASISIRGLVKRFGAVTAVDNLSIDIADKEFVSLLGPSGCGKTTTLQMLAGFLQPDEGMIHVDDQLVSSAGSMLPPERREMGMVFQDYAVWPHKSVFENVAFGLQVRRRPSKEIAERVAEILETVGLAGLDGRYPGELSGGQQQRVALARALVIRPKILLLDEPLSNLDARLRDRMRDELAGLQRRVGITFVYVTHDQTEALRLSDRIVVMNQGKLQQLGVPRDIYERPANRFVAGFMGKVNLLPGTVTGVAGDMATVELASGGRVTAPCEGDVRQGQGVNLSVRPENLAVQPPGSDGAAMGGTVVDVGYVGRNITYVVDVGGLEVHADVHPDVQFAAGSEVALSIVGRCVVFPAGDGDDAGDEIE
ncbi:MAG: ABC transporter ATP-binding protein [Acetobacterales bacterium]